MDAGLEIVPEAVVKTIPKKKKCKKAKWLSQEALQISEKRREVKGKGEKERYFHLNAQFQRTARRNHSHALEKEMAMHSSVLAWRIPWTEESGRLQSTESQTVGYD